MKKITFIGLFLILPFIGISQNLALNKTVDQSTNYSSFTADRAVNGNQGDFTHTNVGNVQNPWWRVDLGDTYTIEQIVIYNRTSSCCVDRLNGFRVLVGNVDSEDPNNYTEVFTLNADLVQERTGLSVQGRYLMVHNSPTTTTPLSLAEVEVYGSEATTGGNNTTAGVWSESGSNIYYNQGSVGIGVTDFSYKLNVAGKINASNLVRIANPNNTNAEVNLGWYLDTPRIRLGGSGTGAINGLDIQTTGNKSLMRLLHNGNVGIGTTTPDAKLAVNGNIHAQEVKVDLIGWPDYVFSKEHQLPTLQEVEKTHSRKRTSY